MVTSFINRNYTTGYTAGNSLFGLFREDTLLGQVWCIRPPLDSLEHIVYNKDWQVGDTLPWQYFGTQGRSTVIGIDSTLLYGEWHRIFHMNCNGTSRQFNDYDIVEGIGSTEGPHFPLYTHTFEIVWQLHCFSQAGYRPPVTPTLGYPKIFDNSTSCNVVTLDIPKMPPNRNARVAIVPNPGGASMTLELSELVDCQSVTIIDALGRSLMIGFDGKREINIGQYLTTSGVYHYRLADRKSNCQYSGSFLFQ
jgi:hypothetical protein